MNPKITQDDEEDEDEDGFIVGDSSGRNEAKEAKEAARALARDREAAQRLDRKVEEEDVEKLQNFVKERCAAVPRPDSATLAP